MSSPKRQDPKGKFRKTGSGVLGRRRLFIRCRTKIESGKKNWGDQAAEYEKKLLSCIEAVDGTALFYENAPVLAAYHAISGGNTESAEVVWGKAYPYLVPCVSTGDLLSPTRQRLCRNFKTLLPRLHPAANKVKS